jgi:hypothetical protein
MPPFRVLIAQKGLDKKTGIIHYYEIKEIL